MPQQSDPARPDRARALAVLGVVALTAALNAPALARWFDNPDDWIHLAQAQAVLAGDPGVLGRVLVGDPGLASLRPVPKLFWLVDYAVWGWSAGGYFLTNLLLLCALTAGVAALVARVTESAGAGVAAASLVGLSVATNQPMYYLAARDDLLAAVFSVGALLAWERGRERLRGRSLAAALTLFALLCKPSGILIPVAMLALDPRGGLRARLGRLAPVLAAVGLYGVMLVAAIGLDLSRLMAGGAPWQPLVALKNLVLPVVLPSLARSGRAPSLVHDLPRLIALSLVVIASLRTSTDRLTGAGLVVCASGALMHLPFLGTAEFVLQDSGRYLLLVVAGVGIAVGGALGRMPSTARKPLVWSVVAASVFGFALGALPGLSKDLGASRALFESLTAERDAGHGMDEVFVGISLPERGLLSFVTSEALARALAGSPRSFMQGTGALLLPLGDHGEIRLSKERFQSSQVGNGTLLVDRGALRPTFTRVTTPPPARGEDRTLALGAGWGFQPDPQWRATPPPVVTDDGVTVQTRSTLSWISLGRTLSAMVVPPSHLGRSIEPLASSSVCAIELSLTLASAAASRGPRAAPGTPKQFAMVMFSGDQTPAHPADHALVVPLGDTRDRQTVRLELDSSPGWAAVPEIRWLGLMPSSVPAHVTIHELRLVGCR
ncbi:MAG: hypothetical protein KDA24_07195 [Deltaproteobacteria bacterium]|nr:hypothetical protein [Deltaproteobacteria bacterium]